MHRSVVTDTSSSGSGLTALERVVLDHRQTVLRSDDARALLRSVLDELGLAAVDDCDALYAVGEALQRRGIHPTAFVGVVLMLTSGRLGSVPAAPGADDDTLHPIGLSSIESA